MLDTTPLIPYHATIFFLSFAAVFGALYAVVRVLPYLEPPNRRVPIQFAGNVVIIAIALIAGLNITDGILRLGLLTAAAFILILGTIDESQNLPPGVQLFAQAVIAAIVVMAGWTITSVTNPFGPGIINLSQPFLGSITFTGAILAVIWFVFLMNAVNWLDGIDGLAPTVSTIAFVFLALVSLLPSVQDQQTLTLAIIGAAATSAFALWNWSPAKVYLGTSGAWFIGLYLGMVAIIGGGKIITSLLILAIPVLDLVAVVIQRAIKGQAPWRGDTSTHLHYRLRRLGFSDPKITVMAALVTSALGLAALMLPTNQKISLLTVVAIILALAIGILWIKQDKTTK